MKIKYNNSKSNKWVFHIENYSVFMKDSIEFRNKIEAILWQKLIETEIIQKNELIINGQKIIATLMKQKNGEIICWFAKNNMENRFQQLSGMAENYQCHSQMFHSQLH